MSYTREWYKAWFTIRDILLNKKNEYNVLMTPDLSEGTIGKDFKAVVGEKKKQASVFEGKN